MRMMQRFCMMTGGMLATASFLVMSGCATEPSAVQLNVADVSRWIASLPEPGADYGTYPNNYRQIIEAAMTGTLKDPDSARYSGFTQPKHDQVVHLDYAPHDGVGVTKTAIYGYAACVAVNAKNSFGGYTGNQMYWLLIRNGQVIRTEMEGAQLYIGHTATCE